MAGNIGWRVEEMEHTMLARVFSLQAEVLAAQAEIEGMKAANQERLSRGEALAYPAESFNEIAESMRGSACQLFQLSS